MNKKSNNPQHVNVMTYDYKLQLITKIWYKLETKYLTEANFVNQETLFLV